MAGWLMPYGANRKKPASRSSTLPNTLEASNDGTHSQSIAPSGATRAPVWQFDRNAYSAIGGNGDGAAALCTCGSGARLRFVGVLTALIPSLPDRSTAVFRRGEGRPNRRFLHHPNRTMPLPAPGATLSPGAFAQLGRRRLALRRGLPVTRTARLCRRAHPLDGTPPARRATAGTSHATRRECGRSSPRRAAPGGAARRRCYSPPLAPGRFAMASSVRWTRLVSA